MDGRARRWSEVRHICVHTASIHLSLFLALLVVMGDERASCPAVARSGNTNNLEQPPTRARPGGGLSGANSLTRKPVTVTKAAHL